MVDRAYNFCTYSGSIVSIRDPTKVLIVYYCIVIKVMNEPVTVTSNSITDIGDGCTNEKLEMARNTIMV